MTAKEYLGQLKCLNICIEQKMAERQALYTTAGTSAPLELSREIAWQTIELLKRKHKIIDQIQGLKRDNHITVLYKRYVEYKSLEKIADEMGYTYQHIRRLHGGALQAFERMYKAEIQAYADA